MLAWLFPLGLAGLAALAVPLLLHLARRREQRVLRFAAMRWLPPGRAPRKRLRLQERPLLLLRLLLVATAALWLTQPILREAGRPQRWLAVSPDVDAAAARSIAAEFDRAVWLTPGIPAMAAGQGTAPPAVDASARAHWLDLLQEFTARLPSGDTATILVPDRVTTAPDALPTLWHPVEWREAARAIQPPAPAPDRLLALRHTDAAAPQLPWLRHAIAAWNEDPKLRVTLDDAPSTTPIPANATAVLWLGALPSASDIPATPLLHIPTHFPSPPGRGAGGEGPPPPGAAIEATTPSTPAIHPARPARTHVAPTGASPTTPLPTTPLQAHPTHWQSLAIPLHPSTLPALYDPDFPHRLHATLFGTPTPGHVPASRLRAAEVMKASPNQGPIQLQPRGLRDLALSPWLAWLLLALFLLERWFATGRRLERAT